MLILKAPGRLEGPWVQTLDIIAKWCHVGGDRLRRLSSQRWFFRQIIHWIQCGKLICDLEVDEELLNGKHHLLSIVSLKLCKAFFIKVNGDVHQDILMAIDMWCRRGVFIGALSGAGEIFAGAEY